MNLAFDFGFTQESVGDIHTCLGEEKRPAEHHRTCEKPIDKFWHRRVSHCGEEGFFCQEPKHRGQTRHGKRCQACDQERRRQGPSQPAQSAQVTRTTFMINDPGGQKQGAFIQCMCDHPNYQSFEGDLGILADQHDKDA